MATVGTSNLRSSSSDPLCVRFINLCEKPVEVLWVHYNGQCHRYSTLKAGEFLDVNTYVKHAWIFQEQETNNRLMANNRPHFCANEFPYINKESHTGRRYFVYISRRNVIKLQTICIDYFCHKLGKCSDVKYLEIPIVLKRRIVKKMHAMNPQSHSTENDRGICEKNLHDFS